MNILNSLSLSNISFETRMQQIVLTISVEIIRFFSKNNVYQNRSQNNSQNDILKKKRLFRVEITTKIKFELKDQDYDRSQ